jgi:hypothetical protein
MSFRGRVGHIVKIRNEKMVMENNIPLSPIKMAITLAAICVAVHVQAQNIEVVEPPSTEIRLREDAPATEIFEHINISPYVSPADCAFAQIITEEHCSPNGEIAEYYLSETVIAGRRSRFSIDIEDGCMKVFSAAQPDHYGMAGSYYCPDQLPAMVRLKIRATLSSE